MSFANSEPDLKTKKQLYELYINVFNSSISSLHKEKILGTIFSYEPKSREPVYKSTGKFPKIDEAIAAAKKYKK